MTDAQIHAALLIAIMSAVTIFCRAIPFLVFSKETPEALKYLGDVLPYSIMAMLVVYCLKGVDFIASPHGIPEVISVAVVVFLHKLKHNTLLSIVGGTVCYMVLVQVVFK